MKTTLTLLFILLLSTVHTTAQTSWNLDNSFGGTGKIIAPPTAWQKAGGKVTLVQPDGKIVVAGVAYDVMHVVIMRFNTDGTPDGTFGNAGIVEAEGPWNTVCSTASMTLQPDGKIVIGGNVDNPTHNPIGNYDFIVWRFNVNGAPDSTFGTNGQAIADVGNEENWAVSVVVQADGKILLGGNTYFETSILRFNPNGAPDVSFGNNGVVRINLTSNGWSSVAALALQPDGKIIGGGYTPDSTASNLALARFNTDGSFDQTFGVGGVATFEGGYLAEGIAKVLVQPDGKILAAGTGLDSLNYENSLLLRCLANGAPDTGFGTGGVFTTSFSNQGDLITGLALQPDGKILTTGDYYTGATLAATDHDFIISRYQPNGTMDSSFGNAGVIITDFGSTYDIAYDVAIQADGRIIVAGETGANPSFAIARYAPAIPAGIVQAGRQPLNDVQAYPNPFSGDRITLTYELAKESQVSIAIKDQLGRISTQLVQMKKEQQESIKKILACRTFPPACTSWLLKTATVEPAPRSLKNRVDTKLKEYHHPALRAPIMLYTQTKFSFPDVRDAE